MKEPVIIDDFKCYAPELAQGNDGFPPDMFNLLAELEEKNFWFKARSKIIQHLFIKYVGKSVKKNVMEIGCGNGFVLKSLHEIGYQLTGSEIYLTGLKNARSRLHPSVELIQLNALDIPFKDHFDAIGAFDVIEHIDDDVEVMKQVHKALKNGGYFIITVPQYQFMWSYLDDFANHKRRYTKSELYSKFEYCGFNVLFCSSFVSVLFPFVFFSRMLKKNKTVDNLTVQNIVQEFKVPIWLNKIFYFLMLLDFLLIKNHISIPFGNSLVLVAQKQ